MKYFVYTFAGLYLVEKLNSTHLLDESHNHWEIFKADRTLVASCSGSTIVEKDIFTYKEAETIADELQRIKNLIEG